MKTTLNAENSFFFLQLHLPTGGKILITRNGGFKDSINVDITPSIYDYGISDGLCGVMDGTVSNDPQIRPGSEINDPNISWRYFMLMKVKQQERLTKYILFVLYLH